MMCSRVICAVSYCHAKGTVMRGLESEQMRRHLVVCWDIPGLPLCHLWDKAKLILALLYELLQLHSELFLDLLVTRLRVHCLQPAYLQARVRQCGKSGLNAKPLAACKRVMP